MIWDSDPVSKKLSQRIAWYGKALVAKESKISAIHAILNDSKIRKAYIQLYPR